MTYLDAEAYTGEEVSISSVQPGNMPRSTFFEAQELGKDWWTCSSGDCPIHQTSTLGDTGSSCQPPAAGISGHRIGERFWLCARKVFKTYP